MRIAAVLAAAALAVVGLPAAAAAQEQDVTRRTWTFLDNRLDVAVMADAPGVLHVVRGERGRIEVAARSRDGFPGFGLGGSHTRQLRLTAVGSEAVQYLVVVPERVSVRVHLPNGGTTSLASRETAASFSWGATDSDDTARHTVMDDVHHAAGDALRPTTRGGLFVAHSTTWAPALVDIPDLNAVRSISVRFEGAEFRVAASRPLQVRGGSPSALRIDVAGDPVDVVLYVPRGRAGFALRSGSATIAESTAGVPRAVCGNVVIQQPTAHQTWFTFHPQAGRLDCR
jgi:hypothetical protein